MLNRPISDNPLVAAVERGDVIAIEALLRNRQEAPLSQEQIQVSYEDAVKRQNSAIINCFQAYFDQCIQLECDVWHGNLVNVQRLISLGVSVNLFVEKNRDGNGYTFIDANESMLFSSGEDFLMTKILIEAGAKINVGRKYFDGATYTPLARVAKNGNKELLAFVLTHAIDFNPERDRGYHAGAIVFATFDDRAENIENLRYLLDFGIPLPTHWTGYVSNSSMGLKKFIAILVECINEKIKKAFHDELDDAALNALIKDINGGTNELSNQKSARKSVRTQITACVDALSESLRQVDDLQKLESEERRIKALLELDILRKKPEAEKEKSAKQKLSVVLDLVDSMKDVCKASANAKALFVELRQWAREKPSADTVEHALLSNPNFLRYPLEAGAQWCGLTHFLTIALNEVERKFLIKHIYDIVDQWSKKYKSEEEHGQQSIIERIKECYDEHKQDRLIKQREVPVIIFENGFSNRGYLVRRPCVLFEIFRTSESGRANVDTRTWKNFVSVMEHGNYLKPYRATLGLFERIKMQGKSRSSENEGALPLKPLAASRYSSTE